MKDHALKLLLEKITSAESDADAIFTALMPALCEVLQCDRCFLYLRSPDTTLGKVPYCWCRSPKYPDVRTAEWSKELEFLCKEDPLFAAALRAEPSIFVEDVETADPRVVNLAFEQENFGHRALIHAHICLTGQLWGVLQPCVFEHPRVWTPEDRAIIDLVTEKITPRAVAYVKAANVGGVSP